MTVRVLPKGVCLMLVVAAFGCDELQPAAIRNEPTVTMVAGFPGPQLPPLGVAGSAACGPKLGTKPATTGMPSLVARPTTKGATPPPPISGGTMLTTADGSTIVAADAERDQIYFVDAAGMKSLHTRKLNDGDQPGRIVEDAAGRVHVILRGAHAVATLGRDATSEITRREVCALPRGIAYDAAGDQLHIVCAEGQLVTLAAAPTALMPTRTLNVATDARDVLVRDNKLFVTRFRAAELLVMSSDGVLQETRTPASFTHDEQRTVFDSPPGANGANGACSFSPTTKQVKVQETPDVAWRTIDVPGAGVTMLHQRARTDEIQVTTGGYGSATCGGGIVQTAITKGLDTASAATADMADLTLAVDIAADPEGQLLAVVAPGNQGGFAQVEVLQLNQLQPVGGGGGAGVTLNAVVVLPSAGAGAGANPRETRRARCRSVYEREPAARSARASHVGDVCVTVRARGADA